MASGNFTTRSFERFSICCHLLHTRVINYSNNEDSSIERNCRHFSWSGKLPLHRNEYVLVDTYSVRFMYMYRFWPPPLMTRLRCVSASSDFNSPFVTSETSSASSPTWLVRHHDNMWRLHGKFISLFFSRARARLEKRLVNQFHGIQRRTAGGRVRWRHHVGRITR